MYILPVPGSISSPQNVHTLRSTIEHHLTRLKLSAHAELPRLSRSLLEHKHTAAPHGTHDVPSDDAPLVTAVHDPDLDLGRLTRHAGPANDLDDGRWNAIIISHLRHLLLQSLQLLCQLVHQRLSLRSIEYGDPCGRLLEPAGVAELGLARDERVRHIALVAKCWHVHQNLGRGDVLRADDHLGLPSLDELR